MEPIIGPSCEHKTENLDKQVMKVNSQQWRMGLCIMLSIVYPHRTTVKDRKDFWTVPNIFLEKNTK